MFARRQSDPQFWMSPRKPFPKLVCIQGNHAKLPISTQNWHTCAKGPNKPYPGVGVENDAGIEQGLWVDEGLQFLHDLESVTAPLQLQEGIGGGVGWGGGGGGGGGGG